MEVRRDEEKISYPSQLHLYTHLQSGGSQLGTSAADKPSATYLTLLSRPMFVRCWTHPAAGRGTRDRGSLSVRSRDTSSSCTCLTHSTCVKFPLNSMYRCLPSMLALNDSRPLAPFAVVLHVSLIYIHHSSYLLYSEGEVLIMYLHL